MNELVITNYKNSIISAVYEDKTMIQVSACRKKQTACVGNIYIGKVDNIVKNINAAFVNISDGVSCYLDMNTTVSPVFTKKQSEKKMSIGDELIVQVTKEGVKTKAPVVSTSFSITGKYVVLVHGGSGVQISKKIPQKAVRNSLKELLELKIKEGFGLVARTNAMHASEEELLAELHYLYNKYERICNSGQHRTKYTMLHQELPPYILQLRDNKELTMSKIITNIPSVYKELKEYLEQYPLNTPDGTPVTPELTEDANELMIRYRINHFMDKALHRMIYLNSGATIIIDPTEALTVIDVNTGKYGGKKTTEETFYRLNLEAAKEIAHQIRLRNLSGIIVVDFIDMDDEEHKTELMRVLGNYLAEDQIKTNLIDMTALGLVEITRKKVRKPFSEQLLAK